MQLKVYIAEPEDASRIAGIHMAAFASNAMLLAQFPSLVVCQALQHSIELKALADIRDSNTTVLVVRSNMKGLSDSLSESLSEQGDIIAFAKWAHPTGLNDGYEEPRWIWPEGTAFDVLAEWTQLTEEARTTALGSQACYRLTFIATDPQHQRYGAASLMVAWGLDRCEKEKVPAYLESTEEAAHLYEKTGFEVALEITMDVTFEQSRGAIVAQEYKEVAMVYKPKGASGDRTI